MEKIQRGVLLLALAAALESAGGELRESELTLSYDTHEASFNAVLDCRAIHPVAKLKDDPALQGLMYSALNWERDAAADSTHTATVTAQVMNWEDGALVSDGSAEILVLAATSGEGTFDWQPTEIANKVYRLTHVVSVGGVSDPMTAICGFFDFTGCRDSKATQADVEAAVLAAVTYKIAVVQDAEAPWQPIESAEARPGIATSATLASGVTTATTFCFRGIGTLQCEYLLTGGKLDMIADGEPANAFAEPTEEWVPCAVAFEDNVAHEVAFVYTAAGSGFAGLRNVRWVERDASLLAAAGSATDVRFDLREGVRTLKRMTELLPFEYSSTNWIGDVVGVSAESVAKVMVVRLTGGDPDVRNWTEELPGTSKLLVRKVGEGSVRWRPSPGVWKATFDILNDDSGIYQETAIFDLRKASGPGFAVLLR